MKYFSFKNCIFLLHILNILEAVINPLTTTTIAQNLVSKNHFRVHKKKTVLIGEVIGSYIEQEVYWMRLEYLIILEFKKAFNN